VTPVSVALLWSAGLRYYAACPRAAQRVLPRSAGVPSNPVVKKKSFSELSPPQRIAAVVSIVVSLVLVTAAERDLQRRPASKVRGDKRLWRLVSLNALGALTYLRWGRRT
jgi:hypothetical protein